MVADFSPGVLNPRSKGSRQQIIKSRRSFSLYDRSMHKESDAIPNNPRGTRNQRSAISLLLVGVIAAGALGISIWALLKPLSATSTVQSGTYSDAQRADAKTTMCQAVETVRTGVAQNTHLQAPGGDQDATGSLAVAANARLSLFGGGQYLLFKLTSAVPQDLADATRKFGTDLTDIGAAAIAGAANDDPAQAARLHDADTLNTAITTMCK